MTKRRNAPVAGWVPNGTADDVVAGGNLGPAAVCISGTALLGKDRHFAGEEFELFWRAADYISATKYPQSNRAAGAVVVRGCEEDDASKIAVSPDQPAPFHSVKGIKRQLKS
jgi:hypothetical protein